MVRDPLSSLRILLCSAAVLGASCSEAPVQTGQWSDLIARLEPLHERMKPVQRGDWLASNDEPGQTFDQYQRVRPIRPHGKRNTIYIRPLGELTGKQTEIVARTAEFMQVFFDTPVKVSAPLPMSVVPEEARRAGKDFGEQIHASYVMQRVLFPELPEDATAYLAFTAADLYAEGMNFVFGQADLRARVGVWSIARKGDPEKEYEAVLLRTIKTATHETGHMFSVQHCIAWQCNMNGSNSLEESDRQPLALCPECHAKVCWACTALPHERYRDLARICDRFGLAAQAARYRELLAALGPEPKQAK